MEGERYLDKSVEIGTRRAGNHDQLVYFEWIFGSQLGLLQKIWSKYFSFLSNLLQAEYIPYAELKQQKESGN